MRGKPLGALALMIALPIPTVSASAQLRKTPGSDALAAGLERQPTPKETPAKNTPKPGAKKKAKKKRPASSQLSVAAVAASVAAVRAGDEVTVRARVRNNATETARPRISVYLVRSDSGKTHLGTARPARIAKRKSDRLSLTVTVPRSTPAGNYRVAVCSRRSLKHRVTCGDGVRTLTVTAAPASPRPAPPKPPGGAPTPAAPVFVDGARSIGDTLFPTIGNGGYDALGYRLDLDYRPTTKVLSGNSTMTAIATQNLATFSLDFQGPTIESVSVDGQPASFERAQTKLIVRPSAGIIAGKQFQTTVAYGGVPKVVVDPDEAIEGWMATDSGAVVLNQPIGAQGWFPNNNTPRDKATFEIEMTVPDGLAVIGNGELQSRQSVDGSTTFVWRELNPMGTFLTTATIGRYQTGGDKPDGQLENYWAIDQAANGDSPAITPAESAAARDRMHETRKVVDFMAERVGPYPNNSMGGIIANAPEIGYALEVNSRPVYTRKSVSLGLLVHEQAHQWFGNAVTTVDWSDLYLAEGLASWFPSYYAYTTGASKDSPAKVWGGAYRSTPADDDSGVWRPLVLRDVKHMFGASTYKRGAIWFEALRQQIGQDAFFAVLRAWARDNRFGNAGSAQFKALVERETGRTDLGPFFDDWLYKDGKPTIGAPRDDYRSAFADPRSVTAL